MIFKISVFTLVLLLCEFSCGVYVYSSFWAPLFDPTILNYKVDVKFDPDSGRNSKDAFERNYGYRGENLIADFGNGKRPTSKSSQSEDNQYGDVKWYYTYPGAYNSNNDPQYRTK